MRGVYYTPVVVASGISKGVDPRFLDENEVE